MCNKIIKHSKKSFNEFSLTFLQVVLNLGLGLIILFSAAMPFYIVGSLLGFSNPSVFTLKSSIFVEINLIIYIFIVFQLRNIIERVVEEKPFVYENVMGFKKTGICILILGIVDLINGIINTDFKIVLVFHKNGSIRPDILLYTIIAFICFVIAEIFQKAIQIKNDNDLTI